MSSGTLRMFLGQGQANKKRAPHVWPRPCTSMQKGHFNMFCQPEGHFIMFHRPWGASKRALLGHSSKHGGTLRSAWAHIAKTLRDLGQHSVAALMSFISLCTRISGGVGGLSKQRGFHTSTSACTGSCGLHEHDHGCGHTNVHGAVYTFECTSQCNSTSCLACASVFPIHCRPTQTITLNVRWKNTVTSCDTQKIPTARTAKQWLSLSHS